MTLLLLRTSLAGPHQAFWVTKVQVAAFVSYSASRLDLVTYGDLGTSYEQVLEDMYEYNGSSNGPQGLIQGGFALEMLRTRFVDSCLAI